jgi:hypothetical protein
VAVTRPDDRLSTSAACSSTGTATSTVGLLGVRGGDWRGALVRYLQQTRAGPRQHHAVGALALALDAATQRNLELLSTSRTAARASLLWCSTHPDFGACVLRIVALIDRGDAARQTPSKAGRQRLRRGRLGGIST